MYDTDGISKVTHDHLHSLAQENLGEAHWLYALMDAQERRNAVVNDAHPTKSAHELVTRRPPLYSQLTAYNFGALAASKVVGPQRPHQPNYELVAVVGSPNDIPGTHFVLRQGETTPVIRTNLEPIEEYQVRRTADAWDRPPALHTIVAHNSIPEVVGFMSSLKAAK